MQQASTLGLVEAPAEPVERRVAPPVKVVSAVKALVGCTLKLGRQPVAHGIADQRAQRCGGTGIIALGLKDYGEVAALYE